MYLFMTAHELRRAYINFFVERGHVEIPSASLVPENDPSVLFTTAGMHPLVPCLKGEPHPAGTRLVGVQKCVRTGDIDEVGDATHLTFFEMLGNWSLGDYFKEEAIRWSYVFLTDVLGIDRNRLAISVFGGDDDAPRDEESAHLWRELGVPDTRIAYLSKDDNWWPAGGKHPGPQGPDTEMFYWTGSAVAPEVFDPSETHWVEIWNDVFMQFDRSTDGRYELLAQKNVDTGMGLERTVAVLQGAQSVYETELFAPIMRAIAKAVGTKHKDDIVSRRIVADHVRTALMMIADGVVPSNKDQGYILRRLIRRAVRRWKVLDAEADDIKQVFDGAIISLAEAYPVLKSEAARLWSVFDIERTAFSKTLAAGLRAFAKMLKSAGHVGGAEAFMLFSTYGFPLELTEELVREQGEEVNKEAFAKEFARHQGISRSGAEKKFAGGLVDHSEASTQLHTATHLLHQALRLVLGDHVFQRGSNITPDRLRFDFSHDTKMTDEQKKRVEEIVNEQIRRDLPVSYEVMSVEDAKAAGAIGIFEDTYARLADQVKVYRVGNQETGVFSREICGGPHVKRTSELRGFMLLKEEASSAGVRRIKAIVGERQHKD